MNSGTFYQGEQKVRAGFYFRFTTAARARLLSGERGTSVFPLLLNWGPSKTFIEIEKDSDVKKKLGLDIEDPSLLLLKELRKRAKVVKLYRVTSGTKATGTLAVEGPGPTPTVTALYGGTKGNEVTLRIGSNVLEPEKKDVTTFLGTVAVAKQTVSDASELVSDGYVEFKGEGKLTDAAGVKLTGGTDIEPTNLDYMDYLAAAELEYFDTIGLPVDGENAAELKAAFGGFIKRIRDEQGIKVQGVTANYPGNHEGVINVTNGAVLPNKQLTPAETVAWVTGAAASATVNQSITFLEYEGAVGVHPEFDNDEIIERLQNGEFLLSYDARDKEVSVEADINSFTSFSMDKNDKFSQNKFIRVIDAINNDLSRELKWTLKELKKKGKDITTGDDGKQIVRTLVTIYLNEMQNGGAIEDFDSSEDIDISVTEKRDGFLIGLAIKDTGAAEKFYFDVVAQ